MSVEFIAECRREWKRLGVPASIADEMAAELGADFDEARADGVSATELVGDDPRAFAASWARARGAGRERTRLRPVLIVLATVAAAGAAVAGTVLLATTSTSSPRAGSLVTPLAEQQTAIVYAQQHVVDGGVVRSLPNGRGVAFVMPRSEVFPTTGASSSSSSRTAGLILLSTGLAFLILLSLAAPRLGRPPARPAEP